MLTGHCVQEERERVLLEEATEIAHGTVLYEVEVYMLQVCEDKSYWTGSYIASP